MVEILSRATKKISSFALLRCSRTQRVGHRTRTARWEHYVTTETLVLRHGGVQNYMVQQVAVQVVRDFESWRVEAGV